MLKDVNGEAEHTHTTPTHHTHLRKAWPCSNADGRKDWLTCPPTSHALITHAGKLVRIMRRDFNISL